jgi:hypothetical protein
MEMIRKRPSRRRMLIDGGEPLLLAPRDDTERDPVHPDHGGYPVVEAPGLLREG